MPFEVAARVQNHRFNINFQMEIFLEKIMKATSLISSMSE
jgi:hypothetical protein